jgi:glycosyltransferase involved in cell wall biosynthesis
MGCPVIVSDLGALPETIVSPEQDATRFTGWLVPANDVGALADRIRLALSLTSAVRTKMGTRASARAGAEFALSQMQAKTLAVYDELLGTRLAELYANPPSLKAASMEGSA